MKTLSSRILGSFLALAMLLSSGCSTTYVSKVARTSGGRVACHTAASLKQTGRKYKVVGMVHTERWVPSLYWSSDTVQRPEAVMADLLGQASALGADAVVDVRPKAENHYQWAIVLFFVPFVFCHEEVHAGATAIKFID